MGFSRQECWSRVPLPSPNMLSRLVITFLPGSKCLLISRLQSPSAVILEAPKIKSATISTVSPSTCHEKTWSTGEQNGKPLQYSCFENPTNSMKSKFIHNHVSNNQRPPFQPRAHQNCSDCRTFSLPSLSTSLLHSFPQTTLDSPPPPPPD